MNGGSRGGGGFTRIKKKKRSGSKNTVEEVSVYREALLLCFGHSFLFLPFHSASSSLSNGGRAIMYTNRPTNGTTLATKESTPPGSQPRRRKSSSTKAP